MNPYDMLVQAVHNDLVVPDIRFNVPAGVATVVPGNLVCDSRDLHRMISEGRIRNLPLPLDTNPRLNNRVLHQPKPVVPDPPVQVRVTDPEIVELSSQLHGLQADLRVANAENQRLSVALNESRTECGKLLAECGKLRAEVARLQEGDSKLNAILGKLDKLPTQVVVQAGSSASTQVKSTTDEYDVPHFIPTFPEPVASNLGKPKTNVVENVGETAGDALKRFRKNRGS